MLFIILLQIQNGDFIFQPNVMEGKGFMNLFFMEVIIFLAGTCPYFIKRCIMLCTLCAGISILLFQPKLFSEKLRTVFLDCFYVFIFLVSNKASFIVLALILILKLYTLEGIKQKIDRDFNFRYCAGGLCFFKPENKRKCFKCIRREINDLNKEARYGFSTRLLSWDAAISLIKERPVFGYGHANAKGVLNKKYEEKGYIFPLKRKL